MDPNEALRSIRAGVKAVRAAKDVIQVETAAEALVEVVAGLDEWITKGGFLPLEWMPPMGPQAGVTPADDSRTVRRLELAFDKAIRDDALLDANEALGAVRDRLIRQLAHEVIREVRQEREMVERMQSKLLANLWPPSNRL
jgi:ribosomal protein S20